MPYSNGAVIDSVLCATDRVAAIVHNDMKRGLSGLATIASVAPWFGLLITLIGIVGSFVGCGGEKSACMAALADRLANALVRCALGLFVGLLSLCYYRYLSGQLEELEIEMRNMALELANVLSARLRVES
jgi:biopolymer transport protein ExbB/TolQ